MTGPTAPRGLPPAVHPVVRSFLADGDRPAALLARWGSPLNLVFPEIFRANLASFRAILDRSGLAYQIHYAHKANQAWVFVRAALDAGIRIDVASPGELASALEAGFPVSRIEATGPRAGRSSASWRRTRWRSTSTTSGSWRS